MKLNTLPTNRARNQSGFTLIEMIGVLAVIAILAALLIPKVFNAIADAKVNNAVVSAETVKTAIADHYGRYGKFDTLFGTNTLASTTAAPYTNFDTSVLIPEGLLDKPFQTKIGLSWTVQFRPCNTVGAVPTGADGSYSLDGNGTNNAAGQYVVEAIIKGVSEPDAQGISSRLDGQGLSTQAIGTSDLQGRVKYTAPAAGANTDVYIYLTHR
jgi:prepilin-type N-terminal cleavage/methylation domain-containing protein